MLHLLRGDTVKAVCYIPMFTEEIPLIIKEHYQFILDTAERFREMGAEVHIVSGMTYWDFCHLRIRFGKNKGKVFGFPPPVTGMCTFRNYSKIKAIKSCNVGQYAYQDIGIACDEPKRQGQLTDKLRSILVEMGYTEEMAWEFCRDRNLLSPHYKYEKRDGCVLCINSTKAARNRWFTDYPEAVPLVIELQEFVKTERPEQTPLRNHSWFIDTEQISFFD